MYPRNLARDFLSPQFNKILNDSENKRRKTVACDVSCGSENRHGKQATAKREKVSKDYLSLARLGPHLSGGIGSHGNTHTSKPVRCRYAHGVEKKGLLKVYFREGKSGTMRSPGRSILDRGSSVIGLVPGWSSSCKNLSRSPTLSITERSSSIERNSVDLLCSLATKLAVALLASSCGSSCLEWSR